MPKPFPAEFRRDVIAVTRQGQQSRTQIARSFGISDFYLSRWMTIADRDEGVALPGDKASPGAAPDVEAELKELRKKTRLLEQENEILRRATAYFARDVPPK